MHSRRYRGNDVVIASPDETELVFRLRDSHVRVVILLVASFLTRLHDASRVALHEVGHLRFARTRLVYLALWILAFPRVHEGLRIHTLRAVGPYCRIGQSQTAEDGLHLRFGVSPGDESVGKRPNRVMPVRPPRG